MSPFTGWRFWTIFALALAVVGFIGREVFLEWQVSRWPLVPCEILQSEVGIIQRGGRTTPSPLIRYRYEISGRTYVSEQIRPKSSPVPSGMEGIQKLLARYRPGDRAMCHVNPRDAGDAVLEAKPNFFLIAFVALTFVTIWTIYSWVPLTDWLARRRAAKGQTRPLPTGRLASSANRTEILVGLTSIALGGAGLAYFTLLPWLHVRGAAHWQETPCRIHDAAVETESHHQGYSFKARLVYSYEFDGRTFFGSKRDFTESLGSNFAETASSLEMFPPGTTNVCYVNPADPKEAVLRREMRPDGFGILFMGAWFGAGVFLLVHGVRGLVIPLESPLPWETRRGRAQADKPSLALDLAEPPGVMLSLCFAAGGVCLFIAAWLGVGVVRSLLRGGFDLLPALYAGLSIAGVWQCVRLGRKHFRNFVNPPPRLGLHPAILEAGGSAQVGWLWKRGSAKVRPFRLWLEGCEETFVVEAKAGPHGVMREQRARKTVFARLLVADVPAEETGRQPFQIPAGVMHSFEGARTKIAWYLRVEIAVANGVAGEHVHKIIIRPNARSDP